MKWEWYILCPGWFGFIGPLPGCCGPPAPGRPTGATIIPCAPDGTGCCTIGCNREFQIATNNTVNAVSEIPVDSFDHSSDYEQYILGCDSVQSDNIDISEECTNIFLLSKLTLHPWRRVCYSEKLVNFYHTTWCNISGGNTLQRTGSLPCNTVHS
jgi:hypothetical protein